MDIKEFIHKKRPSLSKSSIITYASILKNLYIKVFGDKDLDMDKFDNHKKVLEYLEDIPFNKRKTILSALVIITDKKPYRDLMLEDVRNYNKEISKQVKTDAQEEAWVNTEQIKELCEDLRQNAELLYKKKNMTITDLQEIQNYIIVCLLGGCCGIAPRRSKDFVDFKIKSIDKTKHNFLDKNKLVFNSYKTAKTYGQQTVDIPIQLKNVLNKWIKINPTEYLLFDSNMNQLSSVKLNQRLNKLFDKKIGVNGLRHSYLTDKYADHSQKSKSLEKDMQNMGSSLNMADTYIKLD
jgi:integrase